MKIFKLIFLLLILILVGAILYLGYLGFIPVISNLMGVSKPVDLGIKYSKNNYDSYVKKAITEIKYVKTNAEPKKSIKATGIKNIKEKFSSEEISARLNYAQWKYLPVKNTQVKISNEGIVEFSGNLITDRLVGFVEFAAWGKFAKVDLVKKLKYLTLVKTNPPIYIKFSGKAIHNYSTINLHQIKIGRYSVPIKELEESKILPLMIQNIILKINAFHIMSTKFEDGQLIFDGTVPAKMEIESL